MNLFVYSLVLVNLNIIYLFLVKTNIDSEVNWNNVENDFFLGHMCV